MWLKISGMLLPLQASWSPVLNLVKECELLIRISAHSDSPKRRENEQRMMGGVRKHEQYAASE